MCKCLGDCEKLPPSVADVAVLVIGVALLGKGSDRETGLAIFFMFVLDQAGS